MNCHLVYETDVTAPQIDAVSAGIVAIGRHLTRVNGLHIVEHQTAYLPRFGDPRIVDSDAAMKAAEHTYAEDLVVIATQRDLGAAMVPSMLFGDALFGRGKAIVSNYYPADNPAMLKALTTHVMAHSVGLVKATAKNHDNSGGGLGTRRSNHCKNECIMRPIAQKQHLSDAARRMTHQPHGSGFCKDCLGLLHTAHLESEL